MLEYIQGFKIHMNKILHDKPFKSIFLMFVIIVLLPLLLLCKAANKLHVLTHNKKTKIRCYYHLNIQQNFGNRSKLYTAPSQCQACKEGLSLTQGQVRLRRLVYI